MKILWPNENWLLTKIGGKRRNISSALNIGIIIGITIGMTSYDVIYIWTPQNSQFSFGHRIFKNASFDLLFFLKPVLLSWILRISQRQSTTDSSLFSRSRQKCAFFSAENIDSMKNKNFLAQAGGWNGFYAPFWSRKSLVERNSIADPITIKGQRFWLKKSKKGSGRLKNTLKSVFHIIWL